MNDDSDNDSVCMTDAADGVVWSPNTSPMFTAVKVRRLTPKETKDREVVGGTCWAQIEDGCQGRCVCPRSVSCTYCVAFGEWINKEDPALCNMHKYWLRKMCIIIRRLAQMCHSEAPPDDVYREAAELCCSCLRDVHKCMTDSKLKAELVPRFVKASETWPDEQQVKTIARACKLNFRLQHFRG
jgi:hypothetical protein